MTRHELKRQLDRKHLCNHTPELPRLLDLLDEARAIADHTSKHAMNALCWADRAKVFLVAVDADLDPVEVPDANS